MNPTSTVLLLPLVIAIVGILSLVYNNQQLSGFSAVPLILGNVSDLNPDDDLALVVPSKPRVVDITDSPLSEVWTGSQVMIALNATNYDEIRDWACVVIVEVRDSTGVTMSLNWHSQIIDANDTIGLGISWMPNYPDTYSVRTFVISNLTEPRIFSFVEESEVIVH